MNKSTASWATLVVHKGQGGRALILNKSERGLFSRWERYYNHKLKEYPAGSILNVVVRLSETGRRMVQAIHEMALPTGQDIKIKVEGATK
jgi:hypothetical protein